jgi:hypothetical protein
VDRPPGKRQRALPGFADKWLAYALPRQRFD